MSSNARWRRRLGASSVVAAWSSLASPGTAIAVGADHDETQPDAASTLDSSPAPTAAPAAAPTFHVVQPVLNTLNVSDNIIIAVSETETWLPEDFITAHNILAHGAYVEWMGRRFASISSIRSATAELDIDAGVIHIACASACFETQSISVQRTDAPLSPSATGGFLNYELFAQHSSDTDSLGAYGEAGLFSNFGSGLSSFACNGGGDARECVRLETRWRFDDPVHMRRILIGDDITNPAPWGAPVRFAGVSYGTDFSLAPDFVSFPSPDFRGEAALPGSVDVLINDQKRISRSIAPGPFTIESLPLITGAGEAVVIVRDILGREQHVRTRYYAAPQLLQAGLSSWSVEAGALRENFGFNSNEYGDAVIAAGYMYGLTDQLTLGARGELSPALATLGGSILYLAPAIGVSEASLAVSDSADGKPAGLLMAGQSYASSTFNFGVNLAYATRNFRRLGETHPAPQLLARAFVGSRLPVFGATAAANWTQRDEWDGERFSSMGASVTAPVGDGHFDFSVLRLSAPETATALSLTLTLPFGKGSLMTSAEREAARDYMRAHYRVTPESGFGPGYYAGASTGDVGRLDAGASYSGGRGAVQAEASLIEGETALRASASGGIAAIDGHVHLAPRIDGSLALVRVGDEPGVRVYHDRQLAGVTDKDGEVVISNLRPFETNRIDFDPSDLALDATFTRAEIDILPGLRTGHTAQFEIQRGVNLVVRLVTPGGDPLPVGAIVTRAGESDQFVVGYGGRIYVPNAPQTLLLTMRTAAGACDARVSLVDQDLQGPIFDAGRVVCAPTRVLASR